VPAKLSESTVGTVPPGVTIASPVLWPAISTRSMASSALVLNCTRATDT
jgi:hypothetical protein